MTNENIFLGSGASITFIPESDIYFPTSTGAGTVTTITAHSDFSSVFDLVIDLYAGCIIERYNSSNAYQSKSRITSNTATTITFSPSQTIASGDYFLIREYGAPVPAPTSTAKRLLSDQWLGLLESATFPNTEVEMKQMNLSLGGSRNYTYQYKGIETATGGSLGLVANHAAFLYYFFGKCTSITASLDAEAVTNAFTTGTSGAILVDSGGATGDDTTFTTTIDEGPIFFRTVGTKICPPISPSHEATLTNIEKLDAPTGTTSISKAITYTFAEQDSDLLPSFALEQVFSKLPSSNTYRTNNADADEDTNFVKIARGNRVNSLTLTANENEEIKMTLDLNTRAVHNLQKTEQYDARRGVTDETSFFNYNSTDEFREPIFFSSGYFKVFGQQFLKINSLTLTMSNNLQDRRFIGVGNKSIKEGIPAQRTYELRFTGHVTDDKLYNELLNQVENDNTGQYLELQFEKPNGENFNLKFTDYYVSANNFPMADDKGPIVVEATIMPRTLQSCTVKTHWVLQG